MGYRELGKIAQHLLQQYSILQLPLYKEFPSRINATHCKIENSPINLCSFTQGFKGQLFLMITVGIYSDAEIEVKEDT